MRCSRALVSCTRGTTTLTYVLVVGLVGLAGVVAFRQFDAKVETATANRTTAVGKVDGDDATRDGSEVRAEVRSELARLGVEELLSQPAAGLLNKGGGACPPWVKCGTRRSASRGGGHRRRNEGEEQDSPNSPSRPRDKPDDHPRDKPDDHPRDKPDDNTDDNNAPKCSGSKCPPNSPNCFVAGTPVLTAEGLRPIEAIRAGDFVVSRDVDEGDVSVRPVSQTFVRQAVSLVDLHVMNARGAEEVLRATPDHPFFTLGRGWVDAGELTAGDVLVDAEGREAQVLGRTLIPYGTTVYNFEVDTTHTYFAGRLSVMVHNANGSGSAYVVVMTPDGEFVLTAGKGGSSRVWGGKPAEPGNEDVRNNPNQLVFPGGGKENLSAEEAAYKEFKEETGVDLRKWSGDVESAKQAGTVKTMHFGDRSVVYVTMEKEQLEQLQKKVDENIKSFKGGLDEIDKNKNLDEEGRKKAVRDLVDRVGIKDEELAHSKIMTAAEVRAEFDKDKDNEDYRKNSSWFLDAVDLRGATNRNELHGRRIVGDANGYYVYENKNGRWEHYDKGTRTKWSLDDNWNQQEDRRQNAGPSRRKKDKGNRQKPY